MVKLKITPTRISRMLIIVVYDNKTLGTTASYKQRILRIHISESFFSSFCIMGFQIKRLLRTKIKTAVWP
mgnify:FL=1